MRVRHGGALAVWSGASVATGGIVLACTYGVPQVVGGGPADASGTPEAGIHDSALRDQSTDDHARLDASIGDVAEADTPPNPACTIAWVDDTVTSNGSLVLPAPVSSAQGDLLLAYVHVSYSGSTFTLAPPAGWATVSRLDQPALRHSFAVYSKVAGTSEPTTYAWSATGGMLYPTMWLLHYRGVDPADPIDTQAIENADPDASSSATLVEFSAPSVSTAGADEIVIASFAAISYALGSWSTPAGMTQRFSVMAAAAALGGASNELRVVAPGTVGPFVATYEYGDGGAGTFSVIAQTLALRPCQ